MKNWNKLFLGTVITLSALITSCSSDDDKSAAIPQGDFVNGFFVLNEGSFLSTNASVSFVSNEGVVQNNIYKTVNGILLGDTAQSMLLEGDKAYIVVFGSNTIEVVNRYTFERLGTISTGLESPRFMEIENGKGFVTNWGDPFDPNDDFVAVVNLSTLQIETKIAVAEGPERIEAENGKVYVAHSGGYNSGNAVSVINAANNTLVTTITVGDYPSSLVEKNGILYVLCSGKPAWTNDETLGKLVLINTNTNSVQSGIDFPATQHPTNLVEEDGKLYYTLENGIYVSNLNPSSLPVTPLVDVSSEGVQNIYGFEVNDGKIYVADARDYLSAGKIFVFTTNGTLQNTFSVGALPNGFYFND